MFVDMHHHFVYGIDDGAQKYEDMTAMLALAYEKGADQIVATPHATPGRHHFRLKEFNEHFEQAKAWIHDNDIDMVLFRGCEIFYTDETPRMLEEGEIPTIGGSRYILVEFSPDAPIDRLREAARALSLAGYMPIFAHVERYACLRKIDYTRALHDDYQIIMQVNASTIATGGFFVRSWLDKMFRFECVDFVSSDAHNIKSRKFCMKEAYLELKHEYGKPLAVELCRNTARNILQSCTPW